MPKSPTAARKRTQRSTKSRASTRPITVRKSSSAKRTDKQRSPVSVSSKVAKKKAKKRKPNSPHFSESATKASRTVKQAGENMLDILGGREAVLALLIDSSHPKAQALHDRMSSSVHFGETFAASYTAVGLRSYDIVQIFGDVQQARTFISAIQQSDDVMRSLVRAAKDQLEPHDKCNSTGHVVDRKTGFETDVECRGCHGSGYMLKSGARDAQDLYFTLINWKKQGGLVQIDARRQTAIQNISGGGQTALQGTLPGEAPNPLQIIKRADQLMLPAGGSNTIDSTTGTRDSGMPEDSVGVLEAEELR